MKDVVSVTPILTTHIWSKQGFILNILFFLNSKHLFIFLSILVCFLKQYCVPHYTMWTCGHTNILVWHPDKPNAMNRVFKKSGHILCAHWQVSVFFMHKTNWRSRQISKKLSALTIMTNIHNWISQLVKVGMTLTSQWKIKILSCISESLDAHFCPS